MQETVQAVHSAPEGSFQRKDSDASRFAHDLTYGTPDSYYTETRLRESEWTQDVVKRALAMNRSKREHEYLKFIHGKAEAYAKEQGLPSYFTADVSRLAEDRIIERRVVRILEQDRQQREHALNSMIERAASQRERDELRTLLKPPEEFEQEQALEQELPVPDHEGNPIHPRTLDEAQQRMTEELEVEISGLEIEELQKTYQDMKRDRAASRERDYEAQRAEAKAFSYEPTPDKNTSEELNRRAEEAERFEKEFEASFEDELRSNDQTASDREPAHSQRSAQPAYVTFEQIERHEALVDRATDAQERERLEQELDDLRRLAFDQDADEASRQSQQEHEQPAFRQDPERERQQEYER